jgi:L-2-hydroxyglutarate oxidase
MATPSSQRRDVVIVGAGAVGLATAVALSRRGRSVVVLEAEPEIAAHQTGRNSGVIHSGLYYKPGSLKARLCREGREALLRLAREENVPHELCGKLVVATTRAEVGALEGLSERARQNGLTGCVRVGPDGIREREPFAEGLGGLVVPETGIVDYRAVAAAMRRVVERAGGEVLPSARLLSARSDDEGVRIETAAGTFSAGCLVNCAGLQSDRVARLCGLRPEVRIVPFRGEYFFLRAAAAAKVRHLIYPLPDSRFPFLGVHLTRRIGGGVEAGPNAVLAFHREGYAPWSFSARDALSTLGYPGFWRLAARYARVGFMEWRRSGNRHRFARDLSRLVPGIEAGDLAPGGCGIRAQALDRRGDLVDDFAIVEGRHQIHVVNAPSPAATASLAIGEEIARRVGGRI